MLWYPRGLCVQSKCEREWGRAADGRELAALTATQGRFDEAEAENRRADELESEDSLTPFERWEYDIEMTKTFIELAISQGSREAEQMFWRRPEELQASKPE